MNSGRVTTGVLNFPLITNSDNSNSRHQVAQRATKARQQTKLTAQGGKCRAIGGGKRNDRSTVMR